MSKLARERLSKRLVNVERTIRRLEKSQGIKSPEWSINVNPRNTGGDTMANSLTDLQLRFCEEYPKDLNGTQAAIRAGYSEKGAGVIASNLLKMDKVRSKIEELNRSRLRRLNITSKNVLKEIALIAFSNITDVARWNRRGITLKRSSSLSRQETAAIKAITETVTPKTTKLKVELYDKPGALLLLCRYLNILDGNAKVVDPDQTAKEFKEAYANMFSSVPTGPNTIEDVKAERDSLPANVVPGKKGETATQTTQVQERLPFEPKPEDYMMED